FVFLECCKLGIPWLGVIHDWSKLLPSEWKPYAQTFHGPWGYENRPGWLIDKFDSAWLYHQNRNKHHWQYWLLVQDDDPDKILPMPDKYRREMLADWRGAGRAYTGKDNTKEWYLERRGKWNKRLHPETKAWVEDRVGI
ncbi:MAG: hypothetical protein GTO03_07250, partial [Planctomycetales bacterium]|nr:hypothetical protein [Planctomycetales bacterium]